MRPLIARLLRTAADRLHPLPPPVPVWPVTYTVNPATTFGAAGWPNTTLTYYNWPTK